LSLDTLSVKATPASFSHHSTPPPPTSADGARRHRLEHKAFAPFHSCPGYPEKDQLFSRFHSRCARRETRMFLTITLPHVPHLIPSDSPAPRSTPTPGVAFSHDSTPSRVVAAEQKLRPFLSIPLFSTSSKRRTVSQHSTREKSAQPVKD
jgi:hypothetical protein